MSELLACAMWGLAVGYIFAEYTSLDCNENADKANATST